GSPASNTERHRKVSPDRVRQTRLAWPNRPQRPCLSVRNGPFGLNADMVGVHSGVTALIDQGGPSCMTLPGFRQFIVEPARSRVYAFLSAYLVGGLEGHYYPALYRPDCVDVEATVRAARENADLVKGIKPHAELGGF